MFEILLVILSHSITPIVSFVLMLIADGILHNAGLYTLSFVISLILLAVMAISTLINFSTYGVVMKRLCIGLCAVTALFLIVDGAPGKANPVNVPTVNAYSYDYIGYDGGYDLPFTGDDKGGTIIKKDKTCNACSGSHKCHVCSGKGYRYCSGTCISGKCRSCKGTGIYDHGSYVSKCIVCSGDGRCDICNGTNMVDCSICRGKGRCTHCS